MTIDEIHHSADVAVLGLGAIGLPISINLAKSGLRVQVWNRTESRAQPAAAAGARVIRTTRDVDAPIVLSILPDLPQLDEVLIAGLESALRPGDILVIMGTVSPVAVRALGARLASRDVHVVDAPVSGGDVGAWAGTLSIMVGGSDEDVQACMPLFDTLGTIVRHLGALGSGQLAKMCNQIVVGTTLAALGEAINLGRMAGLDDRALVEVLAGGMAGSRTLEVKGEKILSGDFAPGGASFHQLKDLRIALEMGTVLRSPLPVTTIVTRLYEQLVEQGYGELDHSAILLMSTTQSG